MSIFGKKQGQDQAQEQSPAMSREQELWLKYWSVSERIDTLARERKELCAEIVNVANEKKLWRGKTATFEGGNKVRAQESVNLKMPKFFDAEAFMAQYPAYTKVVPDEEKVRALLPDHEVELGKRVIDEEKVLEWLQIGGEKGKALTDSWGIGFEAKITYKPERS